MKVKGCWISREVQIPRVVWENLHKLRLVYKQKRRVLPRGACAIMRIIPSDGRIYFRRLVRARTYPHAENEKFLGIGIEQIKKGKRERKYHVPLTMRSASFFSQTLRKEKERRAISFTCQIARLFRQGRWEFSSPCALLLEVKKLGCGWLIKSTRHGGPPRPIQHRWHDRLCFPFPPFSSPLSPFSRTYTSNVPDVKASRRGIRRSIKRIGDKGKVSWASIERRGKELL